MISESIIGEPSDIAPQVTYASEDRATCTKDVVADSMDEVEVIRGIESFTTNEIFKTLL
jgi:hypothetical protein